MIIEGKAEEPVTD